MTTETTKTEKTYYAPLPFAKLLRDDRRDYLQIKVGTGQGFDVLIDSAHPNYKEALELCETKSVFKLQKLIRPLTQQ